MAGAAALFFSVAYLFLSKKVSPIPYFPSNKKDLPLIIKALKLKNNQTVVDLGAGDGIVVFSAAARALQKKLNTKFIAIELNPILILVLHIRRLFHSNKKNIKITYADIFKSKIEGVDDNSFATLDLANARRLQRSQKSVIKPKRKYFQQDPKQNNLTFYTYISPWFMEKVFKILKKKYPRFRLVSYFYSLPKSLKKPVQSYHGIHSVFTYREGASHL